MLNRDVSECAYDWGFCSLHSAGSVVPTKALAMVKQSRYVKQMKVVTPLQNNLILDN